jgi:hypothetical protein
LSSGDPSGDANEVVDSLDRVELGDLCGSHITEAMYRYADESSVR